MALPKMLILGHSFIRRLDNFVTANPNLDHNFSLGNIAKFKWHGVGGRTVAKTVKYDLPVIAAFAPDIVILQLGTNDLSHLDPLVAGSSIEELVTTLHHEYNVRIVGVCQTLRGSDPVFNARVHALNKYLKTLLEPLPYSFFWGHRGFWNSSQDFLARDGVHLNRQGHFKFFRSLRGAVLRSLRSCSATAT